ncbi:DUF4079 domain-containing protein [Thermosynechococcaceae cyanobacterium BACA0444]|uniref:DUF4079 domain-containing protein n=1 Tax=Pseudocalidococcus azoricus BACA0444 TaxID=2918990 RepID=A0AAE4FU49_9CYAN|nr:DUF4079 domain-containing protein [Pseudocalidococcus azoricus]MDS3862383.1 DUF4079 domain-containing protein [Pseudocalidococcus azoricus BACA0444]
MNLDPTLKTLLTFAHPVLMWVLLGLTLYAMYLGIQIRRTRTADKDAKKELIQAKYNLRHHQISSILLAFMVLGTIGGMGVTYLNNGKLFVGPHLLVGLGMTGVIAISASLTPFLQKGNDIARYSHIFLNIVLTALFGWQAVTGMQIVQKILTAA